MALSLLVIAIVLLVVAAAPDLTRTRDFAWFESYLRWLHDKLKPNGFWDSWMGLTLSILPKVLLLAWIAHFANTVAFGVLGFIGSLLGLFLLLGPRDLSEDLAELAHSHESVSRLRAQKLFAVEHPQPLPAVHLLQPVLSASLKRHYAPIFWFACTGLAGSLAYRLIQLCADNKDLKEFLPERYLRAAKTLESWMAWLPAQAMCLSLALASDFDAVARAWHEHHDRSAHAGRRFAWLDLDMGFLASTLKACIDVDDVDELPILEADLVQALDVSPIQHSQQLLGRITMTWLVAMAMIVLASYLS